MLTSSHHPHRVFALEVLDDEMFPELIADFRDCRIRRSEQDRVCCNALPLDKFCKFLGMMVHITVG